MIVPPPAYHYHYAHKTEHKDDKAEVIASLICIGAWIVVIAAIVIFR